MRLEFADGRTIEVKNREQLEKELDSLNKDNDFAILGDTDYIQTSFTKSGYMFEYKDSTGMYECDEYNFEIDKVKELFSGFLEGDYSWKESLNWTHIGDPVDEAETGSNSAYGSSSSGNLSLKDELLRAAKKSAINWIKRKIR